MSHEPYSLAVLIPCYNEALTVRDVVTAFREQLPQAKIYVYDNNSTDETAELARRAGAIVRQEPKQGKGYVIRRMFADINADIYVLVDGDSTYPADCVNQLVERLVASRLDMVTGAREAQEKEAYRRYHDLGNRLFNHIVGWLFGYGMNDIFSGYRIFSRRFVKSFPALSRGFEIETELSVHALELGLPFEEIPVPYLSRPAGSFSKLNTYKDGFRILLTIAAMFKETRPLRLFSLFAACFFLAALILAWPLVATWLNTGLVPRIPTAVIVIGLFVAGVISFITGLILDAVSQARRENKRLGYLRLDALP
jgi:glycosyltransferase involved in cell wall biosynthesis